MQLKLQAVLSVLPSSGVTEKALKAFEAALVEAFPEKVGKDYVLPEELNRFFRKRMLEILVSLQKASAKEVGNRTT